jgi:hypothetical protein
MWKLVGSTRYQILRQLQLLHRDQHSSPCQNHRPLSVHRPNRRTMPQVQQRSLWRSVSMPAELHPGTRPSHPPQVVQRPCWQLRCARWRACYSERLAAALRLAKQPSRNPHHLSKLSLLAMVQGHSQQNPRIQRHSSWRRYEHDQLGKTTRCSLLLRPRLRD